MMSKNNNEERKCKMCGKTIVAINEQIPKGNQKDRDISSLWW